MLASLRARGLLRVERAARINGVPGCQPCSTFAVGVSERVLVSSLMFGFALPPRTLFGDGIRKGAVVNWRRRDLLAATGGLPWLAACRAHGGAEAERPALSEHASERLLTPGLIYLNTGSLGPTTRAVHDAVVSAARQFELNPVAQGYWSGDTVSSAATRARERIAAFLGCAADELLFTRGATDAMSTVALGMALEAGDRVLTTDQEHEGGSLCWRYLAKRRGVVIDAMAVAPDDDNASILRKLEAAISPRTRVVSVSHVLFTTGRLMPVHEIGKMARAHGLLCVIDGAQAVGALPVDVGQLGCHAYAASGHKWLRGPKGTGFLYVSADAGDAIRPIQWEESRDVVSGSSGLAPLPLFIGLAAAVHDAHARGLAEARRYNLGLREHALDALRTLPKLTVISPRDAAMASSIVTCALPESVASKGLIRALAEKHRVQVKAIEHPVNAIRLSLHTFNTRQEVDDAARALGTMLA